MVKKGDHLLDIPEPIPPIVMPETLCRLWQMLGFYSMYFYRFRLLFTG